MASLRARHIAITPSEYERRLDEGSVEVTFQARVAGDDADDLIAALEAQPGVRRNRVESA
jgi:hypothetical protein